MTVKTSIEYGMPDAHGDIIVPGAIKGLPKNVPVVDEKGVTIGKCHVSHGKDGLEVVSEIPGPLGLVFSIKDAEKIDGVLHIKELDVHEASILPAHKIPEKSPVGE